MLFYRSSQELLIFSDSETQMLVAPETLSYILDFLKFGPWGHVLYTRLAAAVFVSYYNKFEFRAKLGEGWGTVGGPKRHILGQTQASKRASSHRVLN